MIPLKPSEFLVNFHTDENDTRSFCVKVEKTQESRTVLAILEAAARASFEKKLPFRKITNKS